MDEVRQNRRRRDHENSRKVGLVTGVLGFACLGVLVFLVNTNVDVDFSGGDSNKAESDTKSIYQAARQFLLNRRRIPTIEDLTTPDPKGRCYLESLSDDPWGQPDVIEKIDRESFRVLSYGEDLAEGTEDDIVFPVPHDD